MHPRPTHTAITTYLTSLLPPKPHDVPTLYHTPRHPHYTPDTARASQILLSVTPTPGVYAALGPDASQPRTGEMAPHPPRTVCFLHRAFALDRRRVPRGTLVLASHAAFDELLTVGCNAVLAGRLGVDVGGAASVQGYKGDGERKIGMVGVVRGGTTAGCLERMLREEEGFGVLEARVWAGEDARVDVVAIMNAFGAAEVQRVVGVAAQRGWIGGGEGGGAGRVLYLTGEMREGGMAAAREYGMQVVCVGHRAAEEWGIRYLARRLREQFPGVEVKEVYEEEEPRVKKVHKEGAPRR